MSAIWLLCVGLSALAVLGFVLIVRRTHDELDDTVRSFDEFREALSPGVSALGSGVDELGDHADRGPGPKHP